MRELVLDERRKARKGVEKIVISKHYVYFSKAFLDAYPIETGEKVAFYKDTDRSVLMVVDDPKGYSMYRRRITSTNMARALEDILGSEVTRFEENTGEYADTGAWELILWAD